MTKQTEVKRTGLVAKKLGMTRIFDATGKHVPVTVLKTVCASLRSARWIKTATQPFSSAQTRP